MSDMSGVKCHMSYVFCHMSRVLDILGVFWVFGQFGGVLSFWTFWGCFGTFWDVFGTFWDFFWAFLDVLELFYVSTFELFLFLRFDFFFPIFLLVYLSSGLLECLSTCLLVYMSTVYFSTVFFSSVYCLLSTVYCLQTNVYYLLSTVYCLLYGLIWSGLVKGFPKLDGVGPVDNSPGYTGSVKHITL